MSETAATRKTTATVTIVHDPGNPEGDLHVTCTFDPPVKDGEQHLAGDLAMFAARQIGKACNGDPTD